MAEREKASVLVVDDTRVNRIVLENRLKEYGYRVTSVEDGRKALAIMSAVAGEGEPAMDEIDAVILDVMMPGIDGIEVLKELRKTRSSINLPVIMATARDQSEDIVEALRAGANDYVTKPIDIPALVARLETQLALKRSHQSLKDAQRSLIHAAKMETIGYLAAGVAHEIRNPLAQMQMASDGLAGLKAVKENDSARTLSNLMSEAIERADAIVRRLMDFSASARLDLKPGDLNQLIEETASILESDISQSGAALTLDLSPNLIPIRLAANELQQVLINVVLNALQAMPQGDGELIIRTLSRVLEDLPAGEGSRTGNRLRNGDEVYSIEIIDSGTGIPPEHLDSLFDAFFTSKPTGKGTGLGLTVAKKMIDLHGGLISVENRTQGTGTQVTISLPTGERMTSV